MTKPATPPNAEAPTPEGSQAAGAQQSSSLSSSSLSEGRHGGEPFSPHIEAMKYAIDYVVPRYRQDEEGTPHEYGMVRSVAAHWLAGYFAAKPPDTGAPHGEPPACDCGEKLTVCASCAVADWQAAHPDCQTCCARADTGARPPSPDLTGFQARYMHDVKEAASLGSKTAQEELARQTEDWQPTGTSSFSRASGDWNSVPQNASKPRLLCTACRCEVPGESWIGACPRCGNCTMREIHLPAPPGDRGDRA